MKQICMCSDKEIKKINLDNETSEVKGLNKVTNMCSIKLHNLDSIINTRNFEGIILNFDALLNGLCYFFTTAKVISLVFLYV